jgi:uncharacterized protein YndB with AHSA1/START domain
MNLALLAVAAAAASPTTDLPPLDFLIGDCWRGEMPDGTVDTHCFEPVYEGRHVRDMHEVTGGEPYRGETIYSRQGDAITYAYWNSQGGVSRGSLRALGERLDFGEETYQAPGGQTIHLSTHCQRLGEDAYEAVTTSDERPKLSRTVRFERVAPGIAVTQRQAPDGTWTMAHEMVIEVPAAAVWEAIADAAGWKTWAVPVAWTPEPDVIETSYSPDARSGDASTIRQLVLAAIPERLLVFRTIKAPQGFPDFDTYRQTTMVFELEPFGAGRTPVRLTGTGFADSEAGRRLLGFFRDGNRVSLERLRQRLVAGPLDWATLGESGGG